MNRKSLTKEITSSVIEALGKGGGREGGGGASNCICPNTKCTKYGKPVAHTRGTPCNTMKCAKCGSSLTGLGAPKGSVK